VAELPKADVTFKDFLFSPDYSWIMGKPKVIATDLTILLHRIDRIVAS
jgi:hypothetical protein